MKLYIMRHGPAEDRAQSGRDADRALTASGRERVRNVTRTLVTRGETPYAIVTSPLVRAVQTAEIVQSECKLDEPVASRLELENGGRGGALVKELIDASKKRTMLVGHEPDLSDLIAELTGVTVQMEKAMVACISFAKHGRDRPELRFLLDPRSLSFR
jgi:phosphohistidine phosphatase